MKLKKDLLLSDVFCVASGSMISSGLFVLPAIAYANLGGAVFLAYLAAGILVIPTVFSKAELSTAMPKAGGTYFFIDRSMGAGFGTLAGISAWFSLSFKSAFAFIGIGAFASLLLPDISMLEIKLISIACCLLFTVVNLLSVKHTGRFQTILVFGLISIVVYYIITSFPHISPDNYQPLFKGNFSTFLATVGLIFISYGGLTKVVSIAEEVDQPTVNLPRGILLSFFVVTTLYVLAVFVTVGLMGNQLMVDNNPVLTPLSLAAKKYSGSLGLGLLSVAAILAFLTTGNAGILASSRTPLAMSRDRLLPSLFSKIGTKHQTPYISILLTSLFMISVITFLDLEMLVKTASTLKLLLFAFVNISVIIMRESGIQNYRPKFKAPGYPWLQIAGILSYGILIFEMGYVPLVISGGFLCSGLLWYWLYGRIRTNRESAAVHLIRKITARELQAEPLENELREIVRERDGISKDRFDLIIENCEAVDITQYMEMEDFFKLISKHISPGLEIKPEEFFSSIMARENESTTVLTPFLAIPHIILKGEHKFNIILARSCPGIKFPGNSELVHAVFILAGSRDERNFHLQALAAFAQIVQNPDFENRWLKAPGAQALKDIILLGSRARI
ncbi:MAG: amino acid permease [bacterium]